MKKTCPICLIEKEANGFYAKKSGRDGLTKRCRTCIYSKQNHERNRQNIALWRKNNKQHLSNYDKSKYFQERILQPWNVWFKSIKRRCSNPKQKTYYRYGGRGIKCLITAEEIKNLWIRDNAKEMKKPSIDRINNDGNYEFNNCRFIELTENIKLRPKRRKYASRVSEASK